MDLTQPKEMMASLIGRTIVAAVVIDEEPLGDYCGHEAFFVTLDDNRIIQFGAYGYDAWGATVDEVTADDVGDFQRGPS